MAIVNTFIDFSTEQKKNNDKSQIIFKYMFFKFWAHFLWIPFVSQISINLFL